MYKVLLVDDERLILEGISSVVDWKKAGTELAGTARNGLEALDKITQLSPDIVITDIAMPGLDGLGLVERGLESCPGLRFIMLTGYKEFDYACRAMQHGVKHYLLKPCNESQIEDALSELAGELDERRESEQFTIEIKQKLAKVLPQVKEQFFKEWISNKTYGSGDLEYYQELFGISLYDKTVRLLLFKPENSLEYEHLFALRNIAEEVLGEVLLSTSIGSHVLILLEEPGEETDNQSLLDRIQEVRAVFQKFYKIEATAALSNPDYMIHARRLYRRTLECLNHRFYLEEGGLITENDIAPGGNPMTAGSDVEWDEETLSLLIKAGDRTAAEQELNRLFDLLSQHRLDMNTARSYILQLYSAMIRLCPTEERGACTERLGELAGMETLSGLKGALRESAVRLASLYERQTSSRQNVIVDKMLHIIAQNYRSEELTLGAVAAEMLYMNPDYLGKIFKKVTGEKFSAYVTHYRIAKAAEHILNSGDVKVFELAEMFGFGSNAQYFSQVFKKVTGQTPTEYMRPRTD